MGARVVLAWTLVVSMVLWVYTTDETINRSKLWYSIPETMLGYRMKEVLCWLILAPRGGCQRMDMTIIGLRFLPCTDTQQRTVKVTDSVSCIVCHLKVYSYATQTHLPMQQHAGHLYDVIIMKITIVTHLTHTYYHWLSWQCFTQHTYCSCTLMYYMRTPYIISVAIAPHTTATTPYK